MELPPSPPGEYGFSCGEGRLHGTLVVIDVGAHERAGAAVAASDDGRRRLVLPAVLLSLLLPGTGHLLLRAWVRAAIWLVGWIVVARAGHGGTAALALLTIVAALDLSLIWAPTRRSRRR